MNTKLIGLSTLIALILCAFTLPNEDNMTMTIFSKNVNSGSWSIVNDGVMGGISTSSFKLNKDGDGVFEGKVSTANNGGFASVRFKSSIEIQNRTTIKIRLKGDGKNYQFRVKKKSSDFESYITTFSTSGNWEVIEIKLKDLYPSFRGRKLPKSNFDAPQFEEISFLIANKKNESFKLVIDKIEIE